MAFKQPNKTMNRREARRDNNDDTLEDFHKIFVRTCIGGSLPFILALRLRSDTRTVAHDDYAGHTE